MAGQITQNPLAHLFAKAKPISDKHKSEEVEYDTNGGLPAGIDGGVAQLVEAKIGNYKKGAKLGKPFFMASAIVHAPLEHNGIPIDGLRTQIGPRDIEETENSSMEENILKIQKDLKRLLGPAALSNPDLVGIENWVSTCALLNKAKPFFRFRTWKGAKATEGKYKDKEPLTQHVWSQLCPFTPDTSSKAKDSTANPPAATPSKKVAPVANGKPSTKPTIKPAPEPDPEEISYADDEDLVSLGERADNNDAAAVAKLQEMADAAGIEKDAEDNYPGEKWSDLAALLAGGDEAIEEVAEEVEGVSWEVGNATKYKDKECEILTIDTDKGMVTLKDLTTNRVIVNPKVKGKLNPKTKKIEQPVLEVPLDELEVV